MKETLKRDLNKTYLILSSEGTEYEESYEIEMIVQNEPKMFLPLHVFRVDGEIQLFYDISSRQTLGDYVERAKINAETIYALFEAIDRLKTEMKEYLLNPESAILDLRHIYVQEGAFYFCYCPWEQRDVLNSFRAMLEEILGNLDYHDTKAVELAYHLYQNACRGNFEIAGILKDHGEEKDKKTEREVILDGNFQETEPVKEVEKPEKQEKTKEGIFQKILKFFLKKEEPEEQLPETIPPKEEISKSLEFYREPGDRGTEVLGGKTEQTVLLGRMQAGTWKLRPLTPGYEEFCITEESFLVGKKKEAIDGYIGRETISRIHSRLVVKEGKLYIADANSTNGTFVNGKALEPGMDVEIFPGDRILFADVGYECYNSL